MTLDWRLGVGENGEFKPTSVNKMPRWREETRLAGEFRDDL